MSMTHRKTEIRCSGNKAQDLFGFVLNQCLTAFPWFCWASLVKAISKCPENMNVLLPTVIASALGILGSISAMIVAPLIEDAPNTLFSRLFFHGLFAIFGNLWLFSLLVASTDCGNFIFGNCPGM